jgi:hypothetical protein
LRNTLPAECLAALELLALKARQRIEDGCDQQEYGCNDQAGRLGPDANPLYGAHHEVYGGAHVVGAEFANEGVEFGRGWADAEEERYLDEDYDEGADSIRLISIHVQNADHHLETYKQTMLNAMTKVAWKMFAMPSAKQRNMHSTPVLQMMLVSGCVLVVASCGVGIVLRRQPQPLVR